MNNNLKDDVNELVKYLARSKNPDMVDTVMTLTRKLATYEKERDESRNETMKARDEISMLAERHRRDYVPYDRSPNVIELPPNARKVSIEL